MIYVPSELKSTRQRKLPSHLQDFHFSNNIPTTTKTPIKTSPYPMAKYNSYSYLSEPFNAFTNIITNTIILQKYSEAKIEKVWNDAWERNWSFCTNRNLKYYRVTPGKTAVGCKWVFTIKYHVDGSIERHKARLVAKWYTQEEGIDFIDTFSPVAKMATTKILLSLPPKLQWSLHQLEISNAFLNGDLEQEIYMKFSPGYAEIQGESVSPNAVCKLHKSIYGLKQVSRQWFIKFSTTLVNFGFQKYHGDHTLFVKE